MSEVRRYKSDLDDLLELGNEMLTEFISRHGQQKYNAGSLEANYQLWYTESRAVIKQLLPDRLKEFNELYAGDGHRKDVKRATYTIQDWLLGIRSGEPLLGEEEFDDYGTVYFRFRTQLDMLESAQRQFESTLFNIKQLAQADLFDSELDAARELSSRGFLRAAGVVAGVVLERHLSQVMENHSVTTQKRKPTVGDFNDCLKDGKVLDIPTWRNIQRLSDIRNYCGHNKEREPTSEEVEELLNGVDKYTKSLF